MYKCAFCSDQLVVRSVSDNDRKVISLLKEPLFVHLKSGGDQLCYICAVTLSNLYIVLNKKLQDSPFSRPSTSKTSWSATTTFQTCQQQQPHSQRGRRVETAYSQRQHPRRTTLLLLLNKRVERNGQFGVRDATCGS